MKVRASNRPTINGLNKYLTKFLAQGINTYQENICNRGDWAKLMKRRPKR